VEHRELKGQVIVRDQQTVVIGGLISTKELRHETQIPILGDIPVLGTLSLDHKRRGGGTSVILLTHTSCATRPTSRRSGRAG